MYVLFGFTYWVYRWMAKNCYRCGVTLLLAAHLFNRHLLLHIYLIFLRSFEHSCSIFFRSTRLSGIVIESVTFLCTLKSVGWLVGRSVIISLKRQGRYIFQCIYRNTYFSYLILSLTIVNSVFFWRETTYFTRLSNALKSCL